MTARVPLRFFVVTFAWSWILWAPLVLAGLVLDSYVYGHVIQESSFPFATPEESTETATTALEPEALSAFPNLAAMYEHALTYDHSLDAQFEFGLDLVLDGLEHLRAG